MSAAVCLVDVIPQKPHRAIGLGSTITSTVARSYGLRLRHEQESSGLVYGIYAGKHSV
jgi:hypothetical protein